MMRRILAIAAVVLGASALSLSAGEWQDLFPGGTMDEWTISEEDAKVWSMKDGVLVADHREGASPSDVRTKRTVTDFDAELEVRLEEGRIALRKWRSFTLYLDGTSLGASKEWVRIGLSVRGAEVRLYSSLVRLHLEGEELKAGTDHFWLMADPGAHVSFRNVRLREVEATEPDPFELAAKRIPPDLSEARRLFSGSSFIGWETSGSWTLVEGAAQGRDGCWMFTGRPNWGDGIVFFEFQGLGDGEEILVLLNFENDRRMSEVHIPGSNQLDQKAWIPVTIAFQGDGVVLWILGERHDLPRTSKLGKLGFALVKGTECGLREIRIQLDK